jgi:parvulin-like peptidyl-prolyl isomerase
MPLRLLLILRYGLILSLLLPGPLFAAPSDSIRVVSDSARVVAYVNGHPLSAVMLERELVRIHSSGAKIDSLSRAAFSLDNLVQRLINDELMAEEARSIGLDQDSTILEPLALVRDRLATKLLLTDLFPDSSKASEEEVRAEYARMFQRFDLRMMVVPDSALAMRLADSIRQGADMSGVAKAFAADKYREKGGAAGYWYLAQAPAPLQLRLLQSKIGELMGPLHLWRAWALIRVEGKAEADTAIRLDSVRADLQVNIVADKRVKAQMHYADSLRAQIPVVVDSAVYDSILSRMERNLPPSDQNVARVGNGRTLSETQLRNQFIHRSISSSDVESRTLLHDVLNDEVETLLIQEAAAHSAYIQRPEITEPLRMLEDSMLVIAYLEEVVAAKVNVTDEDVRAYYGKYKDLFREPSRFKVATLTRTTAQDADSDYQMLRSGTDFSWLARAHSTDEAAGQGGDRGWIAPTKLSAAARAMLDTLAIGAVTLPVALEESFVIYKLIDRQAGALLPLERVNDAVKARVRRQKQMTAIDETIKALRATAEIKIQQDVVNSLRISGRTEPSKAGHMPMGH